MNEEQPDHRKGGLVLKLGVVFGMLFALTWALPSVFNWVFFFASAYCFFLYWYYQPRKVRVWTQDATGYRTMEERATQTVKKAVRVIWMVAVSFFALFLAISVLWGSRDEQQTDSSETPEFIETDEATVWNEKAYEFYINKNYDSAIVYYDRIIRLGSNNASAWYSKGLVYYDQQQMDKALECFRRAYDAGMRDAFLSHALGYLYDNTGNTSAAIIYYKEAVGLDSTRTDIYTRLAELEPANANRYKELEARWKQ